MSNALRMASKTGAKGAAAEAGKARSQSGWGCTEQVQHCHSRHPLFCPLWSAISQ